MTLIFGECGKTHENTSFCVFGHVRNYLFWVDVYPLTPQVRADQPRKADRWYEAIWNNSCHIIGPLSVICGRWKEMMSATLKPRQKLLTLPGIESEVGVESDLFWIWGELLKIPHIEGVVVSSWTWTCQLLVLKFEIITYILCCRDVLLGAAYFWGHPICLSFHMTSDKKHIQGHDRFIIIDHYRLQVVLACSCLLMLNFCFLMELFLKKWGLWQC